MRQDVSDMRLTLKASTALLLVLLHAKASATSFLHEDGGVLGYDDSGGSGPLVIAVPGMGDLRGEYRALAPYLIRAGFRVVTVDLRGFGQTSARWREYAPRAVAGDLLRIEHALGRSHAIMIGNSISGGAALWAAYDAPAKIDALVLFDPVLRTPSGPLPWSMRAALTLAFAGPWRVPLWLWYWNNLFPTHKPPDQHAYRRALARNLREPGRMQALRTMLGLSKADTAAIVGLVKTPTLVVMGALDPDFDDPAAEARWIADRTGARTLLVPGAGHYPQTDTPSVVAPALIDFLRRTRKLHPP